MNRIGVTNRLGLCFALLFLGYGMCLSIATHGQPVEIVSPNADSEGNFGFAKVIPDARGPGLGNIVVGARWEDPDTSPTDVGRVYIFDGSTYQPLETLVSPNEEEGGEFGLGVSPIPDVNGDEIWDFAIGAVGEGPDASPNEAGRVYIFDGSSRQLLKTLISPNEVESGHFAGVSGLSDVNGNDRGDVIVGAPGEDPNRAGSAYVFDGSSGFLLHTLGSPNETTNGEFGSSVSRVPDVNGDGIEDVLVGAMGETPDSLFRAGRAYLFDGSSGMLIHPFVSPNPKLGGEFGRSVSGVTDVNGDGRGDVVVGAAHDGGDRGSDLGRVYLYDGATGALLRTIRSPDEVIRDGDIGYGYHVKGFSDWNGDGHGEIAVGEERGGPVHIFDGSNGEILYTLVSPNELPSGWYFYPQEGDLNGDSEPDLLVGAVWESPTGLPDHSGRAYVYLSPFPEVDLAPASYDFGVQHPDAGPTSSVGISLTNVGSEPLAITEAQLVGSDSDVFLITDDSAEGTLNVGESRTVEVAFDPVAEVTSTAKLRFVSHSFVWQSELTGIGGEPTVTPTLPPTPSISPTPTPTTTGIVNERADVNEDNFVNSEDLLLLMQDWHRSNGR